MIVWGKSYTMRPDVAGLGCQLDYQGGLPGWAWVDTNYGCQRMAEASAGSGAPGHLEAAMLAKGVNVQAYAGRWEVTP